MKNNLKRNLYFKIVATVVGVLVSASASAKSLVDDSIFYQMAVYDFPGSKKESRQLAVQYLKDKYPHFKIVEEFSGEIKEPIIALFSITDVKGQYPPPSLESIGYSGRSLTREQAEQIRNSDHVLIVNIAYPSKDAWHRHHEMQQFVRDIAAQVGGLIWDEETRELFTVTAWDAQRGYDIKKGIPIIKNHITIHAYNNGEYVRAISLGMAKFGLPDIVINNMLWSQSRSMGNLINIILQSLAEGISPDKNSLFSIDIDKIKNVDFKTGVVESLKPNAKRRIQIPMRKAKPEEGDPSNRILELVFDNVKGKTSQETQEALLSTLFGWEDSIVYVDHDEKILAASAEARKKLPALRAAFNKGLRPGEYIHVKAPFKTPDGGDEWMWVEVISWTGERIKGLLRNEPFHIPDLKVGTEVNVSQEDVFDYIRYFPDGSTEGNETGKLME